MMSSNLGQNTAARRSPWAEPMRPGPHLGQSAVMLVLGIEGSANKVGVGIVREDGEILANPRRTCAPACRHRRHLL